MQELTIAEIEQVEGGSIMGAVFVGLALGTLLVGAYCLWDSTR
jgi:hypothetical protein